MSNYKNLILALSLIAIFFIGALAFTGQNQIEGSEDLGGSITESGVIFTADFNCNCCDQPGSTNCIYPGAGEYQSFNCAPNCRDGIPKCPSNFPHVVCSGGSSDNCNVGETRNCGVTSQGYVKSQKCNDLGGYTGWSSCVAVESCGDGKVNGNEQCDYKKSSTVACTEPAGATGTCTSACKITGCTYPPEDNGGVCGDGLVQKPNSKGFNEQCDAGPNGNDIGAYCSSACTVNAKCNDGADNDGDGFTDCDGPGDPECFVPDGNGNLVCDRTVDSEVGITTQGDSTGGVEDVSVTDHFNDIAQFLGDPGTCGDGIVQNPNNDGVAEQCDDGNNANNDTCNTSCQLTICGDGIVQKPNGNNQSESCDDGNNSNADYCSNWCSPLNYSK